MVNERKSYKTLIFSCGSTSSSESMVAV